MRTYRPLAAGSARALRLSGLLASCIFTISTAQAQDRTYLFELGAGGVYQSYSDSTTKLESTLGLLGRFGVWLPLNFSVEAEGSTSGAKTKVSGIEVGVKTGSASLLYNIPFAGRHWAYGKLGYGQTRYGDNCEESGARICGTTSMFVAGAGVRVGVSPIFLLRAEALLYPNRGRTRDLDSPGERIPVRFTNIGINLGVSVMLGSKPIPDTDGDGVLNNRDRCTGTPAGAQVDSRGCPADTDSDGVANGVDRCPGTGEGALVDAVGCTQDSDNDNIADGIDKCPDTPAGVLVDTTGCPKDSDGDQIADGLDRCSDTPKGATVDALGCPGDEDADGVLDGLDRCPRTPAGANVNAAGCVQGQQNRQPAQAPAERPAPPARIPDVSAPAQAPGAAMVLENVTFGTGSARLQTGSYVELDSIAKVLTANPALRVEIGAHTEATASPGDDMHLSNLRAEAVRNYLVSQGVPFQQVVARGYGGTRPRTPDTTPRGRAANRRIELRPLPPGS
jgi:outer membrane protein OmpA-like peptidoglycan-associated protein